MIKRAMHRRASPRPASTSPTCASLPAGGRPAPAEDARATRRASTCGVSRGRPRGRPDPLLRAARDPAHAGAAEGDREALLAPGAAARRRRATIGAIDLPGARRARATPASCWARSTSTRSASAASAIVVDYGYSAASLRAAARARRRSGSRSVLVARVRRRLDAQPTRPSSRESIDAGEAARRGGRRRPRRRLRPRGRAAVPRSTSAGAEIPLEQTLLLFLASCSASSGGAGKLARARSP